MPHKRPPSQRKRTPQRAHGVWKPAFLSQLSINGNVSSACDAAQVERSTVYDAKRNDPEFAAKWEEAIEIACDSLEAEAWRRAVNGVNSAIYSQGKYVADEIKYSDTLMQTLLKANRPDKFADKLIIKLSPEQQALLTRHGLTAAEAFNMLLQRLANVETS